MTNRRMRSTPALALIALLLAGCGGAGSTATVPASTTPPSTQSAFSDISQDDVPDPRHVDPDRTVPLREALDLVPGEELVWVWTGDSVTGVTADAEEPRLIVDLDFEFGGMVEADGVLWFADFERNSVHRYDLAEQSWLEDIEVMLHPNRIAAHDGSVWVGNGHGRWVSRIDPETGDVLETWEPLTDNPTESTISTDAFWGTSADSYQVFAIEPESQELVAELPVAFMPCGAQVVDDRVWVARCVEVDEDPAVYLFGIGGEPGASVGTPGWFGRVAAIGDRLWIPVYDPERPDDGAPYLLALDRESLRVADAITVGQPVFDVLSAFDALWLTTRDGLLRLSADSLTEN